jgi:hypothetical protein
VNNYVPTRPYGRPPGEVLKRAAIAYAFNSEDKNAEKYLFVAAGRWFMAAKAKALVPSPSQRLVLGLCAACGLRPHRPRRTLCLECALADKRSRASVAAKAAGQITERAARRAAGLCPECGLRRPVGQRAMCGKCAAKRRERTRRLAALRTYTKKGESRA